MKLEFDQKEMEKIARKYGVIAVYVHGSQVKGYAVSSSDTDVAVVIDDASKFSLLEEGGLMSKIEGVLRVKNPDVKVVDRTSEATFLFSVIKDNAVVYERDKQSRFEFEAEVMRKYYYSESRRGVYNYFLIKQA